MFMQKFFHNNISKTVEMSQETGEYLSVVDSESGFQPSDQVFGPTEKTRNI